MHLTVNTFFRELSFVSVGYLHVNKSTCSLLVGRVRVSVSTHHNDMKMLLLDSSRHLHECQHNTEWFQFSVTRYHGDCWRLWCDHLLIKDYTPVIVAFDNSLAVECCRMHWPSNVLPTLAETSNVGAWAQDLLRHKPMPHQLDLPNWLEACQYFVFEDNVFATNIAKQVLSLYIPFPFKLTLVFLMP